MADTPWCGSNGQKLYLQSGQFTSTIKTSQSVSAVEFAIQGNSWDGTDTPWCGSFEDKLYLTSGQFTSTLKTSESVSAIDNDPRDISWDRTNTPWCGGAADKLYLQSGQFTSTLKTSEDVSAVDTSAYGISWDGTNTPWAGGQANKLYLQSGQFTSTLKTSEDVTAIEQDLTAVSYDGTNTPYTGSFGNKLFLQSGQFTSTLKTSEGVTVIENVPTGIDTNDLDGRVPLPTSTVAITATATTSVVVSEVFDTPWSGYSSQKLFLQSGQFTSTLKTSQDTGALEFSNQGVTWDGTNTPWAGSNDQKLYLTSGQFSSTLKTSEFIGATDPVPRGISWDRTNTPWAGDNSDKLFLQSGQFTSTLKTSESIGAVDNFIQGISWDATNTPWAGGQANKLYLQSGQFTSTLKTSEDVSTVDLDVGDISYDGTNTPWIGYIGDKLYLQSGQFTSTIKTSELIAGLEITPIGIDTNNLDGRVPVNSVNETVAITATATTGVTTTVVIPTTGSASCSATLVVEGDLVSTTVSIVAAATLSVDVIVSSLVSITGTATLNAAIPTFVTISATATTFADSALGKQTTAGISATATASADAVIILLGEVGISATATTAGTLSVTTASVALGQAFVSVDISVTMNATNPTLSGDLVDIGNNAVFQLTVNGDLLDFTQVTSCFHAFNVLNLDVGYDGKELTFEEFTGIGSATYAPEQDVTLEIDFSDGLGLTRLFTGRIKQRDHDGRNNNESIAYTAIDYLQLADDLTAVGSDGYPQITWTAPTTVTTITSIYGTFVGSTATNFEVPINAIAPTKIRDAVQDFFSFNATGLSSIGIPTAIGAPGLEQFTGELPETVTVDAQGFASGLISLAGYQTGVKVLFDERQQAWTFPNLQTVPTVIVDVASTNIPELPFSVDTTDRYTAVRLYADITDENGLDDLIQDKSEIASLGGPLGFGKIERSEVTLSNYWLASLEKKWSLFLGLYSDPTQIQGENYFVYRRFKLPEGTERPGFGLEAKAFAQYNQWGNVYWAPVAGQVNWDKRYFLSAYPVLSRGNPWHPGQVIPAQAVKLAYIPAAVRYIPASSITSGGVPVYSGVATTAQRGDFSDELRYPTTGFEGTAFADFGIQREYVSVVDRTEVTVENAKAMLDIRKDAVVSGEIPIEGDPIPELIGLGVKVLVQHPVKSTSIETFAAFVTNYSYEFGKRGQSTISLSTDIAGLV